MDTKQPLNDGDKHFLRLVRKGKMENGWTKVSYMLWPHVQHLPTDLVERQATEGGGGLIKLTERGEAVVDWI